MISKRCLKGFLLLGGMVSLFASCVDDTYDLNKEVSLDVKIENNKISLPVGSLKPIVLDSMISAEDIEMLQVIDGKYCISQKDSIPAVDVTIDEISLAVDPISKNTAFQFGDVNLDNLKIDRIEESVDLSSVDVSMDDMNSQMPSIHQEVAFSLADAALKTVFDDLMKGAGVLGVKEVTMPVKYSVAMDQESADCSFSYVLPKEVKCLRSVAFCEGSTQSANGSLFECRVQHPAVLHGVDKKMSLTLQVPDCFVLSVDDKDKAQYIVDNINHTLTVTNMPATTQETVIKFYIDELKDLDKSKYYQNVEARTQFNFKGEFLYAVSYELDGNIKVSTSTTWEEMTKKLESKVTVNGALGIRNISGDTNPITFEVPEKKMGMNMSFNNLEQVDSINFVRFNAANSMLSFTTTMPGGFDPFTLGTENTLELTIPSFVVLDETMLQLPQGTTYDAAAHKFTIGDVNKVFGFTWKLPLKQLSLNEKVVDGNLNLTAEFVLTAPEKLMVHGEKLNLTDALTTLKSKQIDFVMNETSLSIDEAVIVSNKYTSDIQETIDFSINEAIDDQIGRIDYVRFKEPVDVNLSVKLNGISQQDIDNDIDLNLEVNLPPFLSITCDDPDLVFSEGKLKIKKQYTPGDILNVTLTTSEFDFSKLEEGCLQPQKGSDGKSYLQYATTLNVNGNFTIPKSKLSSELLEREMSADIDVTIDRIAIGQFAGIYSGVIDPVSDKFDLDLGSDLDFLTSGENKITLSDPQIKVLLENRICIPVSADLSLIGRDKEGNAISTATVDIKELSINPAKFDPENWTTIPDSTKLLFVAKEGVTQQGYHTVVVPQLATLLQKIPNSIEFALTPHILTDKTHFADLTKPLSLDGQYEVVVPLQFDELDVTYTDTLGGLQANLSDITDMFTNLAVKVKMDVINTLPLGLSVSARPLDAAGRPVEGLSVDSISIAAGDGSAIENATTGETVTLVVTSDGGDLSLLDQLELTVHAATKETVGGVALMTTQGVRVKNVVLELEGDLETDLNDLMK